MHKLIPFILVAMLTACDSHQVNQIARSPEVKQLAALGESILSSAATRPSSNSPDIVKAEPLVSGGKAVGHRDFPGAKRILPRVYSGMEVDFYCGCRYQGKAVDWTSCGYQPRKSETRASRIEWEHVVPAWVLGHQRQCWQQGGRKACGDQDPLFQMAEGDLNNLVPAVGEVNGDRANFAYGAWEIHPRPIYGQCRSLVDFKLKRFQPREEVRGAAARITLYMHQRYGLRMSQQDRQLMCAWARQYPVDEWERQRNKRIVQWQGEGNFLVSQPEELSRVCG
ncbi:endonuclease [Chromobacterium violaceum]|nr:endonuclease [Chromobacterium violaceum]ATP28568.1 endonuclease [Chromobacterium violaceum]ATP32478.1 endonuclease [Chromobacterium violaceum]MBP4045888.1 endonuclease [Chromobacterium violaceum]OLZ74930.1 endonuclease [Chromobacterium violaceum]OQS08160.1 endonuclease [Chromobacterium violaceum]